MKHPREVLLGVGGSPGLLPVCDHYSGVHSRMIKSLRLQRDMMDEFGACVFDVTLDCEDGAAVGGERDQAQMVSALARSAYLDSGEAAGQLRQRVGVRLHAVDHPVFESDVDIVVGGASAALSYIMLPKVESPDAVDRAAQAIDRVAAHAGRDNPIPLHVLVESPLAVHRVFAIAAHPRVESVSFGLMDFVSAHGGAIGSSAMGMRAEGDGQTLDQFHHPLVVRAKTEIASACHAFGKVPSHCVVMEFRDTVALKRAACVAASALGYTRMWSIHPDQIRPIIAAFTPAKAEIESAAQIVVKGHEAAWAPIAVDGTLHDRASYRYFWRVLERAHQTGCPIPQAAQGYFTAPLH